MPDFVDRIVVVDDASGDDMNRVGRGCMERDGRVVLMEHDFLGFGDFFQIFHGELFVFFHAGGRRLVGAGMCLSHRAAASPTKASIARVAATPDGVAPFRLKFGFFMFYGSFLCRMACDSSHFASIGSSMEDNSRRL